MRTTDAQTGLQHVATEVGRHLRESGATVATAESCTGGLIAHALTQIAGSSGYVLGGVVAYHERIKSELLGVDPDLIAKEGVVSAAVAEQMALGAQRVLGSDWALSTTGVAGPGGGSAATPVGLVFGCVAGPSGAHVSRFQFGGDRSEIKEQAALVLLQALLSHLVPRMEGTS